MGKTPVPQIRNSERSAFQRCVQRWWWSYREGLVRNGAGSTALWFGTGVHLALAAWYCGPGLTRGPEPAETWSEFAAGSMEPIKVAGATDEDVARFEEAGRLGEILMELYLDEYGRDEHKLIISPEQTFKIDVPWPEAGRQMVLQQPKGKRALLAQLVGTYDNVWQHASTGHYWLDEHKTAAAIVKTHLGLDNQGGTYWATATAALIRQGLIPPTASLRGIEYNFIRKALPDDRPRDAQGYATNLPTRAHFIAALSDPAIYGDAPGLGKMKLPELQAEAERQGLIVLGDRSKLQPPPLFERVPVHRTSAERRSQMRRVQDEAIVMETYRRGLLPLTKNSTRDCVRCDFYEPCELQERGGNWEDLLDVAYHRQDPYANHRKSAAE